MIGTTDHLRIEPRAQRGKIAVTRSSEEGFDDLALAATVYVAAVIRSLHSAASAACQLSGGGNRAADDGSNFLEPHREHVMQHKTGLSRSSIASSAGPIEPANKNSCSGLAFATPAAIRSGMYSPRESSRLAVRERNMSRHMRATTVRSQPPIFSIAP